MPQDKTLIIRWIVWSSSAVIASVFAGINLLDSEFDLECGYTTMILWNVNERYTDSAVGNI